MLFTLAENDDGENNEKAKRAASEIAPHKQRILQEAAQQH